MHMYISIDNLFFQSKGKLFREKYRISNKKSNYLVATEGIGAWLR